MNKKTTLLIVGGALCLGALIALMVGMSSAMNGSPAGTTEITTAAVTTAAVTTIAQNTTARIETTFDAADEPDVTTIPVTTEETTAPEIVQTLAPVDTLPPDLSAELDAGNITVKPAQTQATTAAKTTQATGYDEPSYDDWAAALAADGIEVAFGDDVSVDLDGPTYEVHAQ